MVEPVTRTRESARALITSLVHCAGRAPRAGPVHRALLSTIVWVTSVKMAANASTVPMATLAHARDVSR